MSNPPFKMPVEIERALDGVGAVIYDANGPVPWPIDAQVAYIQTAINHHDRLLKTVRELLRANVGTKLTYQQKEAARAALKLLREVAGNE